MKHPFLILFSALTLTAFAQTEPATEVDDADAAYRRMIERKREKMDAHSSKTRARQNEEEKRNDDLDPSEDPIDSEYTNDEGMNDD